MAKTKLRGKNSNFAILDDASFWPSQETPMNDKTARAPVEWEDDPVLAALLYMGASPSARQPARVGDVASHCNMSEGAANKAVKVLVGRGTLEMVGDKVQFSDKGWAALPVHEVRNAMVTRVASRFLSSGLPFDRFYKSLDAIRKELRQAKTFNDLDLAAGHIPTYVRGGASKGFLPKSYLSKYKRLLRGGGLKGLEGIEASRSHWLAILDDMEKSALRMERR